MVTTTSQSDKPLPIPQTNQNQPTNTTTQVANDLNSLSNLTLSLGMWFTTMMIQIDALANRQNKLEMQTSHKLATIMVQLETIQSTMGEYNEYDGYDHNQPFSLEHPNMDKDTDDITNKRLTVRAASDSHMEDASNIK